MEINLLVEGAWQENEAQVLPERIRQYLNGRGISNDLISQYRIGFGEFYGHNWITIPIVGENGEKYLRLRKDPDDAANPDKNKVYPAGASIQIYDWEMLADSRDQIVICEGEFDRLVLLSFGIPAITSTGGALSFKREWVKKFMHIGRVYVCYDNDEAGQKGAEQVVKYFQEDSLCDIYRIVLPDVVGEGGDITDYLVRLKLNLDDLFSQYKIRIGYGAGLGAHENFFSALVERARELVASDEPEDRLYGAIVLKHLVEFGKKLYERNPDPQILKVNERMKQMAREVVANRLST